RRESIDCAAGLACGCEARETGSRGWVAGGGAEALPPSRRSARSFCSETLNARALAGAAEAAGSQAPFPAFAGGVAKARGGSRLHENPKSRRCRQELEHLQRQP